MMLMSLLRLNQKNIKGLNKSNKVTLFWTMFSGLLSLCEGKELVIFLCPK